MPLLEIEQKFSFTLANIILLARNRGTPPFKSLSDIRTQTFHDTYYDSNRTLSTAGLWLRKRRHHHPSGTTEREEEEGEEKEEWEAKQSLPGSSFLRSTFSETTNRDQIRALVRGHFPNNSVGAGGGRGFENGFGLDRIAAFRTDRVSVVADKKFTVVLDVTDFGHWVGEVEVMAEDAGRAHGEIEGFFERYAWFFDTGGQPKGKLRAYFERFGYPKSGT